MGSRKGSPEYWVSINKPNKILYEISGVPETVARVAMRIATYKMPIRIQFVIVISDKNMKGWALCFLKHGRRIVGYNVPSNYNLKIYPGLYV